MTERYNYYSADRFAESLESSFIGSKQEPDDRYSPRILGNDDTASANVLATLKSEMRDCVSFAFSVAFVTSSGMQVLAAILADLRERNIPGRVLTSTYLNFNDPDALRKLLEYPNIETRIYQGDLHAKGYFFNKEQISTIIIGSSNLTQKALTCNKEWNILFRSFPDGKMLLDAKEQYEKLWDDPLSTPLTNAWVSEYENFLRQHKSSPVVKRSTRAFKLSAENAALKSNALITSTGATEEVAARKIVPNKMQEKALEALKVLHDRDEPRALLVSATGTGKTYLSALDVERQKPRKVLFIAHRQRILSASEISFQNVLGDRYSYKLYGGSSKETDATCLFAMVGTLAKHLDDFAPDCFDYIIIDEAHRTGAEGYRKILEYFTPKFVLGMTATPSRTDGYDVYSLFNHVIAYRITLQDALDNELLTPFHYFGIADLEIDDERQDDFSLFNKLTSKDRVDHVLAKIDEYSVEKSNRKKYGSYAAFLQRYEKGVASTLSEAKLEYLKFISTKLASGKRVEDLLMLKDLVSNRNAVTFASAMERFGFAHACSVRNMLTGSFSTAGKDVATFEDGELKLSHSFAAMLRDPYFESCVMDALDFGIARARSRYSNRYKETDFVLNEKYSREDVARLLNWNKEPNYQNIGGYFYDQETKTFPVFIDYEKDPSISITTQYEDRFVSDRRLIAISKSNRSLRSNEITRLAEADSNGMKCYLFMRKNKNDKDNGKEFYFLGEMHPTGEFTQIVMEDGKTSAVEIVYNLEEPVRPDLYDYFLSDFED